MVILKKQTKKKKLPYVLPAHRTAESGINIATIVPAIYYTTSGAILQLFHPSILLKTLNLLVKRDGKVAYLTFLVLA